MLLSFIFILMSNFAITILLYYKKFKKQNNQQLINKFAFVVFNFFVSFFNFFFIIIFFLYFMLFLFFYFMNILLKIIEKQVDKKYETSMAFALCLLVLSSY
ncbi:MAG: hypothetical protein DF280_02540 ['Brassica napus' phytoplasma]|nr:MAG: hypothetical protein DF280_02540 ['Brassica napus' phytoplasma]